ncbi:MAG: hypothetical protein IGQ45_13090 [Cyanobacterium sp. T60_A2020_053]|nr:hypothetical protein [Cyanobacterium sp. T60_A2020_053]
MICEKCKNKENYHVINQTRSLNPLLSKFNC